MPKRQPVLKYQLPPIGMVTGSGGGGGSILGDTLTNADSVDGFHAYATAMPNSLCALDDDAAGPFDITGDADTVDGLHASAFTAPQFLTLATDSNLSNERVLTAGDGLDAADGGAGGLLTLAVDVTDLLGNGLGETANNIYCYALRQSDDGADALAADAAGDMTAGGSITFAAAETIGTAAGNLTIAPAGDLVLNPTGNDVYPATNYDLNLGLLTNKFLTLHAAELWVETLVAQDTMATIGGRVLVGPTTTLTADLGDGAGDTTITVKHNQIANGDRVVLQANGKLEWMAVTSSAGGSAGAYTYSVTRDLDGSGRNTWSAGDAVFNTGTTGDGFIDLYSVNGIVPGSTTGPTIVGNVRTGTTYNNLAPMWAIGNLNGLYGISDNYYGVGLGDYSSGNYLRYENNGSLLMKSGGGYVILDTTGLRMRATATRQVANSLCWNDSSEVEVGFINVAAGALGGAMFVRADEAISLDTDDAGLSLTATGIAMGVDCRIGGGLYVGGDSDPGVGEIHATSGMVIHDPGSPYYGYGINMDAATGTWARGFYFLNGTASLGGFGALGDATPAITYFWSGDAYNDTTARFYPSGGQVVIGQDAPAAECTGPSLTISQGGNDAAILCLQSSDVAHGMTDLNDTDTFGVLGKIDGNTGGLLIVGYDEGDVGLGLAGRAVTDDTAKSTSGLAYVTVYAQKKASATVGAVGSDANLFAIRNYATTRFLFDAEGSSHSDVEWTTFDAHDDVALLDALDQPFDAVKAEFGGWLVEQRDVLQRERVVNFYDDGPRAMVNFTRLAMLHTGAIRQLARRLERYEAELLRLGANPQALLN